MKYLCACTLFLAVCWLSLAPARAQFAVLKDEATPLYEKPSAQSKLVAVLAAGDTVRILKKQKGWAQLRFRDKQKGWMQLRRRMEQNGVAASPGANGEAQNLAANQLAVSERNAGFSPKTITTRKQPPVDGGLSLSLGTFGGDFSYVGRFFYRNLKSIYL